MQYSTALCTVHLIAERSFFPPDSKRSEGIFRTIVINRHVAVLQKCAEFLPFILYQSAYDALVANKTGQPKTKRITIAGKCCESGNLIGENMPIQPCEVGDTIAVFQVFYYNTSRTAVRRSGTAHSCRISRTTPVQTEDIVEKYTIFSLKCQKNTGKFV